MIQIENLDCHLNNEEANWLLCLVSTTSTTLVTSSCGAVLLKMSLLRYKHVH